MSKESERDLKNMVGGHMGTRRNNIKQHVAPLGTLLGTNGKAYQMKLKNTCEEPILSTLFIYKLF